MSLGDELAGLRSAFNQEYGTTVTVTRRGGASRTLRCQAFPLDEEQVASLRPEAGWNMDSDLPHAFVFDGDVDVRETLDTITFRGFDWAVVTTSPLLAACTPVRLKAVGVRVAAS